MITPMRMSAPTPKSMPWPTPQRPAQAAPVRRESAQPWRGGTCGIHPCLCWAKPGDWQQCPDPSQGLSNPFSPDDSD
jgi:hypothetical protein